MKFLPLAVLATVGLLLGTLGCGHVDLAPERNPNRTVSGTVGASLDLIPPSDAVLVVRVVRPPNLTSKPSTAGELVIGEQGTRAEPEQVVAEQIIRAPSPLPVSYRIDFHADDSELRHGLTIEARLSWGGRLRFRNIEAQLLPMTVGDAPVTVMMEQVR